MTIKQNEKDNGFNKEGNSKEFSTEINVLSSLKEGQQEINKQEVEKNMETEKQIQKKVMIQKSDKDKLYRIFGFNKKEISEDNRTVDLAFSSEEPYDRSFGTEILSHNPQDVDFSFIASGRAPLLLNHDLEKQIGVIEEAKISDADKVGRAVVRFGKSKLADEVFHDVVDGDRKSTRLNSSH